MFTCIKIGNFTDLIWARWHLINQDYFILRVGGQSSLCQLPICKFFENQRMTKWRKVEWQKLVLYNNAFISLVYKPLTSSGISTSTAVDNKTNSILILWEILVYVFCILNYLKQWFLISFRNCQLDKFLLNSLQ